MMGSSHAVTGSAAWIAVTSTAVPALALFPLSPASVLLGSAVCAGAALLPDSDHHNATIAFSVPVLGKAAASAIETVSGGHRHGMHSLLAIGAAYFLTSKLNLIQWTPEGWDHALLVGSAVAVMACTAFAVKVLRLVRSWLLSWLFGALVAGAIAVWAPGEFAWLPLCIALGFTIHLLGDLLTVEGIPLLWPVNIKPPAVFSGIPVLNRMWKDNGYFSLPILGHAGSWREWLLMVPIAGYIVWGVGASALSIVQTITV
jgi:hypothetical protein